VVKQEDKIKDENLVCKEEDKIEDENLAVKKNDDWWLLEKSQIGRRKFP